MTFTRLAHRIHFFTHHPKASEQSVVSNSVASPPPSPPPVQDTEQQSLVDLAPSRDELLNLFKQFETSENGATPKVPFTELIQLLGGIQVIMQVMLKAPNHSIPTNQRIKMQQLLQRHLQKPVAPNTATTTPKDLSHITMPSVSDVSWIPELQKTQTYRFATQDVGWTLDPNNNILHDISPHLEKFIFSKYMLVILMVLAVIIMSLPAKGMAFEIFTIIITWFCFIPWNIAALMSVNREMIPRIVATVDTWIKTVTMIITMIYTLIYNIMSSDEPLALHIVFFIGAATNLSLLIIVVCSVDGIHQWGTKARISLVMIVAAFALFWSINYHFFMDECIVTISALGDWSSFSIRERVATAWEILFIFLWKQAFLTWRRAKNRCIAVRYAPFIEWKVPLSKDQTPNTKPKQDGLALWCSCCSGCPLPF